MLKFETASGAVYEISTHPSGLRHIRRAGDASDTSKRADGEWLRLEWMLPAEPKVGYPVSLLLEPLSGYGPDDEGNAGEAYGTTRLTTAVVRVWEEGA